MIENKGIHRFINLHSSVAASCLASRARATSSATRRASDNTHCSTLRGDPTTRARTPRIPTIVAVDATTMCITAHPASSLWTVSIWTCRSATARMGLNTSCLENPSRSTSSWTASRVCPAIKNAILSPTPSASASASPSGRARRAHYDNKKRKKKQQCTEVFLHDELFKAKCERECLDRISQILFSCILGCLCCLVFRHAQTDHH